MNPEEFANFMQLYELNRAQQALNKQINQDQNLSENSQIRNFNFDETNNSIFHENSIKLNSNSHLKNFIENNNNNNNFLNFLFNCNPIASRVVSSSTSVSTSTLISTNRDLLYAVKPQKNRLNQVKNAINSNPIQSKIMLKRRFVENSEHEDQLDKKLVKKLCQEHKNLEEKTDFQNFSTNSSQSNLIGNVDIGNHIQNQDDHEMDNYSDLTIDNEILEKDVDKNRLPQNNNNNETNFDLQQKKLFEVTLNFKNDLLSKCSLDLFSPILLPTQLQISDKKLTQDDMLKNIKNYDSYLECNEDQCQIRKLRDHFHCNYDPCIEKSFTKRDEIIRHIKWHKKRLESLNQGFLRFSSTDDCTQFKMQNTKESSWTVECQHNRKQTHYHCIQPNCDKIYISTSDVQMHSNYHRKNIQLSLDGFQRFRANEKCNKDYCLFNKQHTTHFHCLRENCKFTFKNKSDVEKHKTYHNRDFELLKDGFKKFLKNDQCIYRKCRFSKVCNHIHCMRQDCNYILHSSGQLLSHKRRHDRLDAETGYHHHNKLQVEKKQQNNSSLSASTGLAAFPEDLSLINFNKMEENISRSQGSINSTYKNLSSSFKLRINHNNIESNCTEEPEPDTDTDLVSIETQPNFLERFKIFEQFSKNNNDPVNFIKNNLTKNMTNENNLLCSSMLNSFLLNDSNCTTNNNLESNQKLEFQFEDNTKLQSLNKSEIDLMINKYFTINDLKSDVTNYNDVEGTSNPQTDKDDGDRDDLNGECSTVLRSKLNSLVSNQKYFYCKIINCNKIIKENLLEILEHMMFHERQIDESGINLSNADSLKTEKNLVLIQNENSKNTVPGAERSMQITSIDGLFNRKRGRPPKNRFVEVYLNNENHQSPQAVFTSFKLTKHKEISSLETDSDQFKCFNLVSKKEQIFDRYEEETTTKKAVTGKSDKNYSGTHTTDDNCILKTLNSRLDDDKRIADLENEVSTTSTNIQLNNFDGNFDMKHGNNLVSDDDQVFSTKEKLVKTVQTFYPQSSITISSEEISKSSSPIYLKQYTKRNRKSKKKINKYCNTCNLQFEDIEESKAHVCCNSVPNAADSSFCTTADELKSILELTSNKFIPQNHSNEQPVDLSLNRVTDKVNNCTIENLQPHYFPPVVHLAQNLALLQQQLLPYLTVQKAIKENFENSCLLAMTAAISDNASQNPHTNVNCNKSDIFSDIHQQTSNTNSIELEEKNAASTEVKTDGKYRVILPGNVSDQTINECSKKSDCNFKALKDEVIPNGYTKFRFNEDCQFSNCSYRNHQTHFHCARIDCYYSFCDKTRFVQHTARHERLDKLMGDDFKQYRANIKCNYEDCEHYTNRTNQIKKSSHFHCLKCNFICSDTNKVVAHRRQHNKTELIELAGFRKITNNEKCYIKFQRNEFNLENKDGLSNMIGEVECSYSLKQTHYHCTVCDGAVLSKAQFNVHKHLNVH